MMRRGGEDGGKYCTCMLVYIYACILSYPGPVRGPSPGPRTPRALGPARLNSWLARPASTQRDHGFRTHLRYKGVHSFAGLLKKQCVPVAACIQCANKYNWRDHHRQFRPGFFLG